MVYMLLDAIQDLELVIGEDSRWYRYVALYALSLTILIYYIVTLIISNILLMYRI